MRALVFWGLILNFRQALSAVLTFAQAGLLPQLTAAVRLGAPEEEVMYRHVACKVLRWEAPDA